MRNFILGLMGWLALSSGVVQAEVDPESARDTVLSVVNDFKTKVVANRDELANDPEKLNSVMKGIMDPVVDFNDLAKKVMGKYYRRASDEQIKTFAQVTERTLLNTYSAAVIDFDPSKIQVLPLAQQKPGREVRVDASFNLNDGSPINISFYMEPEEDSGNWLLSNVVINNINFGLTFRKQFGLMVQQNRNDLDKAIMAWQQSLVAEGQ
ncbi:ABC transporter substrate-binding protein [Marinomonas piezotolerans]|uniref:ABC transporter substrate-binding protein n=1 Tax=Marinomonas piezotolerans TaxID=2213058 RepID=A0A370UDE4_9GAMM|nr:ABC transporter substrate-binding protein [Marinomonas piezotolerans]RDL45779.1 ABC transporter substrate-binding protein [Marinomonas piezotolerans]